jgi:leader peptidase (prepilin peptidase) / N-methyltransferase
VIDLPPLELVLTPWGLGLLGLVIGSFLNVVIFRLPAMLERQWWSDVAEQLRDSDSFRRTFAAEAPPGLQQAGTALCRTIDALAPLSLTKPGSRCPSCGHRIRWHENIPVLGWLRLRGRCSACGVKISARYPLVELSTGLLFAAVAWQFGAKPVSLLYCGLVAALVALTMIDWDTTVLPDAITLPLLWAGVLAAALGWLPGVPLTASIWGAAAGYLALWSVYWLFKLATGKEGMGYGDFKLLAALGAWLSWQAILPIVLMASVLGAGVGIVMKVQGNLRGGRFVPFGPFLAGGGIAVLLIGLPSVLEWMGWA